MSYKKYAAELNSSTKIPSWWGEWFGSSPISKALNFIAKEHIDVPGYLLEPEGPYIRRDGVAENISDVLKQLGHEEYAEAAHEAVQDAIYDDQPFPLSVEKFLQWIGEQATQTVPAELWPQVYATVRKKMVDSDVNSLLSDFHAWPS